MHVESLQDLLIDELKDLYSAEKQIAHALPRLAKAAASAELSAALENHLDEAKVQMERLEKIGEIIGEKLTGKTCVGMVGVPGESFQIQKDTDNGLMRDAALIAAAQRMEHYVTEGYVCTRELATELGLTDVAGLLQATLAEEKAADERLTEIAKRLNSTPQRKAA